MLHLRARLPPLAALGPVHYPLQPSRAAAQTHAQKSAAQWPRHIRAPDEENSQKSAHC